MWHYGANILIAVVILVVGWVAAWIIANLIRRALARTSMHRKFLSEVTDHDDAQSIDVDRWISRTVFAVLMVFVIIAVFEALLLRSITTPLSEMLSVVLDYAPQVVGALLICLAAWAIATLLRTLLRRGLGKLKLDEQLGQAGIETDRTTLAESIATTVYWLVLLLFLPAVLGALDVQGLLGPVEQMVNKIMTYLPNIAVASLILAFGWVAARIIQGIVTHLLASTGIDRAAEQYQVTGVLGRGTSLSGVIGIVVHVMILLPVIVAALNALQLDALTQPAERMLNLIIEALPRIFAAAIVLAIAYFVGRLVGNLVTQLLTAVGFDRVLSGMGLKTEKIPESGGRSPSQVLGYLVLVAILLFATTAALGLLEFQNLATLLTQLLAFFGQVLVGLLIIGFGIYLSNLAANTIRTSDTAQAELLARVAQVAVIVLFVFMGLEQTGIGEETVNLAFGLTLGSAAVAAAIAFGLGGRDLAARELEEWLGTRRPGRRKSVRKDMPTEKETS